MPLCRSRPARGAPCGDGFHRDGGPATGRGAASRGRRGTASDVFPIRLITPSRILPAWTRKRTFSNAGWNRPGLAVLDASALANLHLGPKQIGRRVAQRISGRLKLLETLVRRLILVLALKLSLVPAAPPAPRAEPTPKPEPDLPDGVELAHFPRLYPKRLNLLPARHPFEAEGGFPASSSRATGPVSPHRLMVRIVALQRVIADPDGHALRLARHLRRLQERGEPRPVIGPAPRAFRLSPELGAIAALLPVQIQAALETWGAPGACSGDRARASPRVSPRENPG